MVIMLIGFRVYLANIGGILENDDDKKVCMTSQLSLKDLQRKEVDIRKVFHCNGLLLCTTKDKRLVVWNPVSGETKWIQPTDSYKNSDIFALGYDSESFCYKILQIEYPGANYEVYDINSNSSSVAARPTDWFIPVYWSRGVSVKGNTYWLACTRYWPYNKILISFGFSTERFQSHPLPHTLLLVDGGLSVVRENQLCILTSSQDNLDVWMASKIENAGVMSWSKFITLAKDNYTFGYWLSFLSDEQNRVVVCCDKSTLTNNILHIAAGDRYIQVDLRGAESSYQYLLSYVPTLVHVQKEP